MSDSLQEKTEQPTDKKIQDARKKGQIAQSRELSTCFIILFTSIFLYCTVAQAFGELFKVYTGYVRNIDLEVDISNVYNILSFGLYKWFKLVAPVFGLIIAIVLFSGFLQTGFLWSMESMSFKVETLNVFQGIKKLFKKRTLVEVIKSILKIIILAYLAYSVISKELPYMIDLAAKDIHAITEYAGKTIFHLSIKVAITLLFIAGLDFLYQKWQHKKDLMMTQQEVKEEYKEREGNPKIKSRIRSLQMEMSRRRMIEDVKTADMVVTNPTTFAIALSYKMGEMQAPRVVAKGAGFVAEKIKEVARGSKVPIIENKPLARGLFYAVKVGDYIPEEFYIIVAELLAQVFKNKKSTRLL